MGIDIGSVKSVGQLDPPWSVASMKQRLGRSGRRAGEVAIMRVYTRDESPHESSTITDLLFPKLLRAAALARLMFQKWQEPHDKNKLDLSTLVHQILSCLRESGGMPALALFTVLIKHGAFRNVEETLFRAVLRSLGAKQIIEQMPTGEIILTPEGEGITAGRDFYAAFASSEEFSVRHNNDEIGKLQSTLIPPVGENLILGGRRWRVDDVDALAKIVRVSPAAGGKAPVFRGSAGEIHNCVAEEMAAVLNDLSNPIYLDEAGHFLLKAARETASRSGVLNPGFIERQDSVQWFPWLGTRGLLTLELHARCEGLSVERDELSITYKKTTTERWRSHLAAISSGRRTALDLARQMSVKTFDKFDDLLTDEILDEANARDRLDLEIAKERSMQTLSLMANAERQKRIDHGFQE
jgi:ATP-dependent Lhr-like helicase